MTRMLISDSCLALDNKENAQWLLGKYDSLTVDMQLGRKFSKHTWEPKAAACANMEHVGIVTGGNDFCKKGQAQDSH